MTTKPQSTTETLDPCPFCGITPIRRDHVYRYGSIVEHPENSYCPLRYCTIGINAWNTRCAPASAAPVVDDEAEKEFLEASVAVWREIDRLSSLPEGYKGLPPDTDPRIREQAAWERYRSILDAAATAQACAKCGHDDGTDPRGRCVSTYYDAGGSLVCCGCKCEFKTTVAPVEQSDKEVRLRADLLFPSASIKYDCIDTADGKILADYLCGKSDEKEIAEAHLHLCHYCQEVIAKRLVDRSRSATAAAADIVKAWLWHTPEHDQERARVSIEAIIGRHYC